MCTTHKNTKLLVEALSNIVDKYLKQKEEEKQEEEVNHATDTVTETEKFTLTYKDLMKMIVCDTEQLECMVHCCENCPGFQALQIFLQNKFTELNIDDDVSYSQWESTDRTSLRTNTLTVDKFIELLVYSVGKLTTHSFITVIQTRHLKSRKANIDESTCIILLDFDKNYYYVVQDETQGYHWNKKQCTLHLVIIYYKDDNNELQHHAICIMSADVEHDTSFVHQLQTIVNKWIRENSPSIKFIEYFSDSSAGQYKNYKNLLNLCYHKKDFQLDAVWSFFATSSGKSPCDEIGYTVKRKIMHASLQRPVTDQTLSFDAVGEFCKSSIESVLFMAIAKEEMVGIWEELEATYSLGSTVSGTRICHHFQPTSMSYVEERHLSIDTVYPEKHSFSELPDPR